MKTQLKMSFFLRVKKIILTLSMISLLSSPVNIAHAQSGILETAIIAGGAFLIGSSLGRQNVRSISGPSIDLSNTTQINVYIDLDKLAHAIENLPGRFVTESELKSIKLDYALQDLGSVIGIDLDSAAATEFININGKAALKKLIEAKILETSLNYHLAARVSAEIRSGQNQVNSSDKLSELFVILLNTGSLKNEDYEFKKDFFINQNFPNLSDIQISSLEEYLKILAKEAGKTLSNNGQKNNDTKFGELKSRGKGTDSGEKILNAFGSISDLDKTKLEKLLAEEKLSINQLVISLSSIDGDELNKCKIFLSEVEKSNADKEVYLTKALRSELESIEELNSKIREQEEKLNTLFNEVIKEIPNVSLSFERESFNWTVANDRIYKLSSESTPKTILITNPFADGKNESKQFEDLKKTFDKKLKEKLDIAKNYVIEQIKSSWNFRQPNDEAYDAFKSYVWFKDEPLLENILKLIKDSDKGRYQVMMDNYKILFKYHKELETIEKDLRFEKNRASFAYDNELKKCQALAEKYTSAEQVISRGKEVLAQLTSEYHATLADIKVPDVDQSAIGSNSDDKKMIAPSASQSPENLNFKNY
jgi:hypothetical protein